MSDRAQQGLFIQNIGFSTGPDRAAFWDKGTEVHSMTRNKGTMGQAQSLTKRWDGRGRDSLSKSGTGRGTGQYNILKAFPVLCRKTRRDRVEKTF